MFKPQKTITFLVILKPNMNMKAAIHRSECCDSCKRNQYFQINEIQNTLKFVLCS
jgi:hypothetical protein